MANFQEIPLLLYQHEAAERAAEGTDKTIAAFVRTRTIGCLIVGKK